MEVAKNRTGSSMSSVQRAPQLIRRNEEGNHYFYLDASVTGAKNIVLIRNEPDVGNKKYEGNSFSATSSTFLYFMVLDWQESMRKRTQSRR